MKRVEIEVPRENREAVSEILHEYGEDLTTTEVEKEDRPFVQFEFILDSEDIDALAADVKAVKDLERGELTIEVIDEVAFIEKGERRRGGTQSLSIQEMYSKAFEFSIFTKSSWALIALAASIAVFGVIMANVMVVIGAMVIAPMLGPFLSTSFGLVVGDNKLITESITYGLLSILFAMAVSFIISLPIPVEVNNLMLLIAEPGFVTIPLSLAVGSAAALTFTTEAREALAGVAVAIALVPPSAVAGIALSMSNLSLFFNVILVIVSNVMSLILAGSLTFKAFGVAPSTYYRQKVSEAKLQQALMISISSILLLGSVVGFISFQEYQAQRVENEIETTIQQEVQGTIMEMRVEARRDHIQIDVVAINPDRRLESIVPRLERKYDRRIRYRMTVIDGEEYGSQIPG